MPSEPYTTYVHSCDLEISIPLSLVTSCDHPTTTLELTRCRGASSSAVQQLVAEGVTDL